MIKSFKGMILDEGQDQIYLSTNNGRIGYRIVRFDIMTNIPHVAGTDTEHVVMVWKAARTATQLGDPTTTNPDFSDNDLLAVGVATNDVTGSGHGYWDTTIFDNEIFNQDIFVTNRDEGGSVTACNYYIELEVMELSSSQAEYTTLKDIRGSKHSESAFP